MRDRTRRLTVTATTTVVLVTGMVMAAWPVASADKTGLKPAWRAAAKHDMVRLDIGMDGAVVYARDGKKLTGLSATDGAVKYQSELPGFEENGFWGEVEDTTYVYCTGKEVVGIDIGTGKERWRKSPGDGIKTDAWREPRVGHPKAMLLSFENGVSVWDIAPGRLLWSAREPLSTDLVPNAWADDSDRETGVLMFLDKRTVLVGVNGKELWSAADKGNERRGGKEAAMSAVYSYGKLLLVYLSKQVTLLNAATGEVLASESFPSEEAAADVEALQLQEGGAQGLNPGAPLALTLGGRLIIADPRQGKVLAKTPESSVAGQAAGGFASGGDAVVLTSVRGSDKAANAGLHLYRINPATGEVKWHAQNGQLLGTGNVLSNIVGDKVNGPYRLEQAKGVLLTASDSGVRLYDWEDGKERWAVKKNLPYSYRVTKAYGGDSFTLIRSMFKNRLYVSTNPRPVESDGVVYVADDDTVFAIDAAKGTVKWESKSGSLSLITGLAAGGGTVIARQGLLADSNDDGTATGVVTQLLGPTFEEEAEVYLEEDPYGYVGLDAATGKESWKCLEFEARDREMTGPMPRDNSICRVAKVSKEKGCKLGKLDVGKIFYAYPAAGNVVYVGKDGMAGAPPGSCTASWKVEGSVKKHERIYEDLADGQRRGSGFVQHDAPPYLITRYEKNLNVVDVAAGKILVSTDKAETARVKWSKKMLFVAEGHDVAMYKLP